MLFNDITSALLNEMLVVRHGDAKSKHQYVIAFRDKIWITDRRDDQDFIDTIKAEIKRVHPRSDEFHHGWGSGQMRDTLSIQQWVHDNVADGIAGFYDYRTRTLWLWGRRDIGTSPPASRMLAKVMDAIGAKQVSYDTVIGKKSITRVYKRKVVGTPLKTAYHGTASKYLEKILGLGLMPGVSPTNYPNVSKHLDKVFLDRNIDGAIAHADHTASKINGRPVVIEFEIPDAAKILPDYDIETTTAGGTDDGPYFSIDARRATTGHVGVFAYKGRIPARFIKSIHIEDAQGNWHKITSSRIATLKKRLANLGDDAWYQYGVYESLDMHEAKSMRLPKATVGSKEFQAWFNGSKVVDAKGKPLIVYHGTPRPGFTKFATPGPANTTNQLRHLGAWFTSDSGSASSFTKELEHGAFGSWEKKGASGGVYPVFLSIKNPKIYEPADPTEKKKTVEAIELRIKELRHSQPLFYHDMSRENQTKYDEIGKEIDVLQTKLRFIKDDDPIEQLMDDRDEFAEWLSGDKGVRGAWRKRYVERSNTAEATAKLKKKLMDQGYDGIILKSSAYDMPRKGTSSNQYVVFNPSQIKSAITARKFDSESEDIGETFTLACGLQEGDHPRVPSTPDIHAGATEEEQRAYWKAIEDELAAIKKIANDYSKYDAVKLTKGKYTVIIHPSTKVSGKWQVSRLTVNGEPWGDTTYPSMRAALAAELRDGYQIVDARKFPSKISPAKSLP